MRQFLSPRFWLSLGAVVALALLLVMFLRDSPTSAVIDELPTGPTVHRVDLVAPIATITTAAGFEIADGVTSVDMALQLDGSRTMVVTAGTAGQIDCPDFPQPGRCTVVADLLGDAVLWFAVVPGPPGATVTLPAVAEILESGWVQLANGWQVRRASVVERSCADDTGSLGEFIRTFGDSATSTFNLESQRVVRVTCPAGGVAATTTTAEAGPGETVFGGGGEGDDVGDTVPRSVPVTTTLDPAATTTLAP